LQINLFKVTFFLHKIIYKETRPARS